LTVIALAVTALALGVGGARIEDVRFVRVGPRSGFQLRVSHPPARVVVHREGNVARVSLEGAALGALFSGGGRFEWLRASAAWSPSGLPSLEAVRIQTSAGEVSLYFPLPPETAIEVRQEGLAVTLVFREPPTRALPTLVASAAVQRPPPVGAAAGAPPTALPLSREPLPEKPAPAPPVVIVRAERREPPSPAPAERAPEPEAPPKLTAELGAELLRTLRVPPPDRATTGSDEETPGASSEELYRKLFPFAPPEPQEATAVAGETGAGPAEPRTLTLGFLTLRPALRMSYTRGQATLESARPVKASYLQIQPSLDLTTSFWDGRLGFGYEPYLRGFSSYAVLDETTHRAAAWLDLPVGTRFRLKATDAFTSGVLETQEVDPGYEYFFGLSRFRRNTVSASGSFEVAPRLTIEAGGALSAVRFGRPVGFFPYDSRSAFLGLGFELAPRLKATLDYVYDRVPPPDERPVVESTAHSAQVTISGDITPFLAGQLTLGYRDQTSPRAPESGRRFRGPTTSGSLTRAFGASALTLAVSRATPVSNFENNAFYVSTNLDGSLLLTLPLALSLESGIGHRWNDYRTDAFELGRPRNDKVLGWRVALRRTFGPGTGLAVGYRRDRRRSNLDPFDSDTNSLIFQLDFNVFGSARYR